MSSLRFASFGAATVPLSKIVVDKALEMGQYPIIANMIKAPYRLEELETVELDWGDIPAGDPIPFWLGSGSYPFPLPDYLTTLKTFEVPPGDSYTWRFKIVPTDGRATAEFKVTADGVELHHFTSYGGDNYYGEPVIFDLIIPAGTTVEIQGRNVNEFYPYSVNMEDSSVQNLGIVGGAKTFDLAGKWLALGIDMKGLAATIKIQGVEIPYSDYPLYFPLAPTELKIPGEWDLTQERPVIKVYKGI